jgi:hypothetical protein
MVLFNMIFHGEEMLAVTQYSWRTTPYQLSAINTLLLIHYQQLAPFLSRWQCYMISQGMVTHKICFKSNGLVSL